MAENDDTKPLPAVEDPDEVLADAEVQLRRQGDLMHELAQQLGRTRRRLQAAREGKPRPS